MKYQFEQVSLSVAHSEWNFYGRRTLGVELLRSSHTRRRTFESRRGRLLPFVEVVQTTIIEYVRLNLLTAESGADGHDQPIHRGSQRWNT